MSTPEEWICGAHKGEPHVRGCPECDYLKYEATGGYAVHGYDYFEPGNPDNVGLPDHYQEGCS